MTRQNRKILEEHYKEPEDVERYAAYVRWCDKNAIPTKGRLTLREFIAAMKLKEEY